MIPNRYTDEELYKEPQILTAEKVKNDYSKTAMFLVGAFVGMWISACAVFAFGVLYLGIGLPSSNATDSAHATLSFVPGEVHTLPNQFFTVSVLLDPHQHPVTSVRIELEYDEQYLSLESFDSIPGMLPIQLFTNGVHAAKPTMELGIQPGKFARNPGSIAAVTFRVNRSVNVPSTLWTRHFGSISARVDRERHGISAACDHLSH